MDRDIDAPVHRSREFIKIHVLFTSKKFLRTYRLRRGRFYRSRFRHIRLARVNGDRSWKNCGDCDCSLQLRRDNARIRHIAQVLSRPGVIVSYYWPTMRCAVARAALYKLIPAFVMLTKRHLVSLAPREKYYAPCRKSLDSPRLSAHNRGSPRRAWDGDHDAWNNV